MKTAITSIVGLVIITTVIFAQRPNKENDQKAETIELIKAETIGGTLDFTSVLNKPEDFPINYKGVRFNKNDYYVFLWGQAVSDMGLESSNQAAQLWEEIHNKKLTGPQRTALRIGFGKEIR